MIERKPGQPRGLLHRAEGTTRFRLERYLPSPPLTFFVEHYWSVHWDLRGEEPYVSENLPHPSVHMVLETLADEESFRVYGVITGKFARRLAGSGRALGIKFRPGGFHAFAGGPVSRLTDCTVLARDLFPGTGRALDEAVRTLDDDASIIAWVETFLLNQRPQEDAQIDLASRVAAYIRTEPSVTKVNQVAARFGMSQRTLQRLFSEYVGVGPKWLIQRYRLHDALEQLDGEHPVDWAALAQRLGYFDQAHFIKDFKAMIGVSPEEYMRRSLGNRDSA